MNCLYCNKPCGLINPNNTWDDRFFCEQCEGSPSFSSWNSYRPRYPWQVDYTVDKNNMIFSIFFYPATCEAAIYISSSYEKMPYRFISLTHPCLIPSNLDEFVNRIIKLKAFL